MRIKSLEITNAGRHLKIDFDCDAAVVGVIGANGTGKSTVLSLIKFALTGDIRDTIDSYVRNYTGSGSVKLKFEKNGKQGTIFRQFGSNPKRQLNWDNREIKLVKEIDATLSALFGADRLAVSNAVFIEQGELESILFTLASERKKAFIKMVNLSYCEQRAKLVEGRIKSISSSITDLGPARDAAAEARRLALVELESAKEKLAAVEDWTAEKEYVQRVEEAQARVTQLDNQINQISSELVIAQQQLQTQLDQVELESMAAVGASLAAVDEAERKLETEITQMQTVRSELQHYDRVSENIKAQVKEIRDLDAEYRSLNPENSSLTLLDNKLRDIETSLKLINAHTSVDISLTQEQDNLVLAEDKLNQLVAPEMTAEDLEKIRLTLEQDKTSVYWLDRTQKLRKQIAECVQAEAGRPAECSECGMIIQDGAELTPEEIGKADQHLAELKAHISLNQASHDEGRRQHIAYNTAANKIQGEIDSIKKRLLDLKSKKSSLEGLPEKSETELRIAQTEWQTKIQRIKQIPGERDKASDTLRREVQEKQGYKTAAVYQNRREEVSQDRVMEKTNQRDLYRKTTKMLKDCMLVITPLTAKIEEKESRVNNLSRELLLDKEKASELGSERLEALLATLSNPQDPFVWARLKTEIQSNQDRRNVLVGREQSASSAYEATNAKYHEIEERIKQDEVKLNLVADLRRLRDLLQEDGLPMAYIRYQFEHLTVLTQESLSQLNANFAIQIDRSKDMTFSFTRLDEPGGAEHAMNKLSGGQRVRLCVAFLMAVQRRIVKDVGLLVLDEPSVHLDQAGVDEMVEFLRNMQQVLQNTDHQLWVVDHTPDMQLAMEKCLFLK